MTQSDGEIFEETATDSVYKWEEKPPWASQLKLQSLPPFPSNQRRADREQIFS